jgi:hypothetical protein
VLQVVTEFLKPPSPQSTPLQVNGITDQQLDFGVMTAFR